MSGWIDPTRIPKAQRPRPSSKGDSAPDRCVTVEPWMRASMKPGPRYVWESEPTPEARTTAWIAQTEWPYMYDRTEHQMAERARAEHRHHLWVMAVAVPLGLLGGLLALAALLWPG